jgi:hypothetical protein
LVSAACEWLSFGFHYHPKFKPAAPPNVNCIVTARGEGTGEGQTGNSALDLPQAASRDCGIAAHGTGLGTGEGQNGNLDPAPSALSVEPTAGTQNPSETQPFPNHPNGGITSASLEGEAPRRPESESESEIPNRQSDVRNQQSQSDCVSAPSRLCVGSDPQNPAKTLPFPSQNSGGHNSNLSRGNELDGEVLHEVSAPDSSRVSPPAASAETDPSPTGQINDPNCGNRGSGAIGNSGPFPRSRRPQPAVGRAVPSAPHTPRNGSADSQIENPNSKIAEP